MPCPQVEAKTRRERLGKQAQEEKESVQQ